MKKKLPHINTIESCWLDSSTLLTVLATFDGYPTFSTVCICGS